MHRRVALAALVLAAAVAVPGASVAGSYLPPPGDARPVWSPDGSRIAFLTTRAGTALADVPASAAATSATRSWVGPATTS